MIKDDENHNNEDNESEKQQEYHILKIIDKSKFLKKERALIMKQIRSMMHVDHPAISSYNQFFMSSDFFYYISKLKLKCGHQKEFQHTILPSLQSIPSQVLIKNAQDEKGGTFNKEMHQA